MVHAILFSVFYSFVVLHYQGFMKSKLIGHYFKKDYTKALETFEKLFLMGGSLHRDDYYFYSLLKNKDVEIEIDESHVFYKRLESLQNSFNEKYYKYCESIKRHNFSDEEILENCKEFTQEEKEAYDLERHHDSTIVQFGKYAGKQLWDIIKEDPNYVLCCIINHHGFAISKGLLLHENLRIDQPLYVEAVEINLIKLLRNMNQCPWMYKYELEGNDVGYYFEEKEYSTNSDDEDAFNALTDGQLGNWVDFDGDIDDVRTWLGR